MNFYEALKKANEGFSIVSNTGEIYLPSELKPIWCGQGYAGYTSCGISVSKIEGDWFLGMKEE